MNVDSLGTVLLLGSTVLLVAVGAVRLSTRTGLPSLMIYLGLGLLIGERGLGLRFDDAQLTGVLGYAALVIILAEGGLTTRWPDIRPTVAPAAVLAVLGTSISIVVTGAAAHWLLDLDWRIALLIGATLSSTDAAAVFSVLRNVPLPKRLVGLLEAESGFNDAPAVIAVVALTGLLAGTGHSAPAWILVLEALAELAIGTAVGLVIGRVGALGLRGVALPSSGLYPIAVMALAACAYGSAATLHGSGFLATYLACLVLGNAGLPHSPAVRGFAEGTGWIAQIGLFVLLGLLADPARLNDHVLPSVVIGLVLLFVARPLSLLATVTWFRIPLVEQVFLSWAGLRGAVPIVLATIPLAANVPGAERIFDLVFVLVVIFTVIQGPTLPWVAKVLRLAPDVSTVDLDVESSPLGALDADVIHIRVGPGSRLHGVEIFELRLPSRANVTLVVRDGTPFVPGPTTVLRHGDGLIVVAAGSVREATVRRLEQVSRGGKLAGWLPGRALRKVNGT
ncbi:MAG: potassium/hydrogen antiporter [Actinomycetota bacterium]|nr:potassium/hydrogen antiporter [Actinomycetota bacterium]